MKSLRRCKLMVAFTFISFLHLLNTFTEEGWQVKKVNLVGTHMKNSICIQNQCQMIGQKHLSSVNERLFLFGQ